MAIAPWYKCREKRELTWSSLDECAATNTGVGRGSLCLWNRVGENGNDYLNDIWMLISETVIRDVDQRVHPAHFPCQATPWLSSKPPVGPVFRIERGLMIFSTKARNG